MTDLEITKQRRSTRFERRSTLQEQIFFSLKNYRIDAGGCWIWCGPLYRGRYGTFMAKKRHFLAHRASYQAANGPIADGLVIDHLCRNPLCINPAHLEAVSNKENILRGTGFGGINARKTHCPLGHAYSGLNAEGRRICRPCMTQKQRERRHG